FFEPPVAFYLRCTVDNEQGAIAELARLDHAGTKIISKSAGVAVNFQSITRRQRIDATELEDAFGAVFELAKDGEQIGNDHFVALSYRMNDFPARKDAGDVPEPTLQYLD